MSKVALERVTSSFGFQAAFNDTLAKIENEFTDKVLYRDNPEGTTNEMKNDLDMGSHDVLNVKMVDAQQFRVGGVDLDAAVDQLIEDLATIPAETMGYRDEAIAAKNAAQLAESGAQASEDAAQASALTASTQAGLASTSASQAAVSASEALAQKQLAALFAGNASQSATDALGHATDAAASATQAAASALAALAADASADGTNSGNETTTTVGTLINGATAKTTPVDADMVGLMDSAAANVLKKLSWLNIKATLKTYFDTLYSLAAHVHSVATTSVAGFISATDKTKLDGIEAGAQINANITKAEIEAKLIGVIATHSHSSAVSPNSISNIDLADMAVSTIKGRATAGTGDPEDLTATQVRTILNVADGANAYVHPNHSGDVTSVADGATTIAANAVTNAKAADMAVSTIKGRATAGTGDPEDLTATQVRTILNVADGSQKNSDITKAEIEAKLTGVISSHSHSGATPSYNYQEFTSSGTFTVPTGITQVHVTTRGGGGGGRGAGGTATNGGTGGTSSFGAYLSANGGNGGSTNIADLALAIYFENCAQATQGSVSSSVNKAPEHHHVCRQGNTPTRTSNGTSNGGTGTGYGAGGGGGSNQSAGALSDGQVGGVGGLVAGMVTGLTPGANIPVTVGAAGTAGSGTATGGPGTAGIVIVSWWS